MNQNATPTAFLDPPAPPAPPVERVLSSIRLTSDPTNAEITIDGDYWGSTPAAEIQATTGSHTVSVKKRGFKLWERTIKIAPGEMRALHAELEAEARDPNKAKITGLDPGN